MNIKQDLLHSFCIVGVPKNKLHKQNFDSNGNAYIDSDPLLDTDDVQPQILDYYPEKIKDKENQISNLEFLYLQAVQTMCFQDELDQNYKLAVKYLDGEVLEKDVQVINKQGMAVSHKIVNYDITDAEGKHKFMSWLVYKDVYLYANKNAGNCCKAICPKALVIVSHQPMFKVHTHILKYVFSVLI